MGIGHLVHKDPCEPEIDHKPVSAATVDLFFYQDIHVAEEAIKRVVTREVLTQRQFDGLVSYVFNRGATGAGPVLREVNRGDIAGAASIIRRDDTITVRSKYGIKTETRLPGITRRRQQEAADLADGK